METACCEGVTAAHAIHDMEVVGAAVVETGIGADSTGPAVVGGTDAAAQGGDEMGEAIVLQHLAHVLFIHTERIVALQEVGFAVGIAQTLGSVSGIAEADVHIGHHGREHFLLLLHAGGPELCPVVKVKGDGDAILPGLLQGGHGQLRGIFTEHRGDAGHMKEIRILENGIEVKFLRCGFCDSGIRAVIDHAGGPDRSTVLQVVKSQTIAAAHDVATIDAEAAQGRNRSIADGIGRNLGEEDGVVPEFSEGGGNIGLRASVVHLEGGGLGQTLIAGRCQAKHQLAQCNNLCHAQPSLAVRTRETASLVSSVIFSKLPSFTSEPFTIQLPPQARMRLYCR